MNASVTKYINEWQFITFEWLNRIAFQFFSSNSNFMQILSQMISFRQIFARRDFLMIRINNREIAIAYCVKNMKYENVVCDHCQQNFDSFHNCVVISDLFDNFCANCHHDNENVNCNFKFREWFNSSKITNLIIDKKNVSFYQRQNLCSNEIICKFFFSFVHRIEFAFYFYFFCFHHFFFKHFSIFAHKIEFIIAR